MASFAVIADFNINGMESEIIYNGPDEEYARDLDSVIDDYTDKEFRTLLMLPTTKYRMDIWEDNGEWVRTERWDNYLDMWVMDTE